MRVLTFQMTSEGEMRSLASYLFTFLLMPVIEKKKKNSFGRRLLFLNQILSPAICLPC